MSLIEILNKHTDSTGKCLDFIVSGSEFLYKNVVLVCFSGAISNRNKKDYPFYSGVGISKNLQLTCISISDQTLSLSDEISLAWYAGSLNNHNYQKDIAEFIDKIPLRYKVIFFGGSGGGFASLAISSIVTRAIDIFVWNPQTSISNYNSTSVIKYLSIAFPNESSRWESNSVPYDKNKVKLFLSQNSIIHDVSKRKFTNNKRIIYFQNQLDRHMFVHAIPFFKAQNLSKLIIKGKRLNQLNENWLLYMGKWGAGHSSPPKQLVEKTISFLSSRNCNLNYMAQSVDLPNESVETVNSNIFDKIDLSIKEIRKENKKYFRLEIDSAKSHIDIYQFKFAFYLFVGGNRVNEQWYTNKYICEFEITDVFSGQVSGQFFIRDSYSKHVSKKIYSDIYI